MEFLTRLVLAHPRRCCRGSAGTAHAQSRAHCRGIAIPSIGALLKPFVTEAVFVLLCIAFLRVDAAAFRIYLGRPMIVLAATAWTSLVIPTVFSASYLAFGLKDQSFDLFLALVLQAIASPLMAAPAFAALMGLDATLVLCTMVTSTALLPSGDPCSPMPSSALR
jgi:BASS family bile acid:Na+ symporter